KYSGARAAGSHRCSTCPAALAGVSLPHAKETKFDSRRRFAQIPTWDKSVQNAIPSFRNGRSDFLAVGDSMISNPKQTRLALAFSNIALDRRPNKRPPQWR